MGVISGRVESGEWEGGNRATWYTTWASLAEEWGGEGGKRATWYTTWALLAGAAGAAGGVTGSLLLSSPNLTFSLPFT